MRSFASLLVLFALVPLTSFGQYDLDQQLKRIEEQNAKLQEQQKIMVARMDSAKLAIIRRDLNKIGLPRLEAGDEVIVHAAHMLVYSEKHEQPKWVAHIAVPDLITGNLARIDSFSPDPMVKTGTAVTADYWNSGYDRGHLVPSADMRWNLDAMKATYLYSNISPQVPELNRGTWAELEDWGRRYVNYSKRRIFVVTGPVLRDGLPTMQKADRQNEVSIPEYFFKVIADLDGDQPKAIAFVMRNAAQEYPPISYSVTVDSVEAFTGIDFFPALDDATENRIEAMREPKDWYAQGDPFFGEVEPLKAPLPKGMFNTVQAKYHIGQTATICGTVVSSRKTVKAKAIYLNFDRMHPHQDFYATIWEYNGPNFSYDPEVFLVNKKICVTGKVTIFDDIPRISINNESEVMLYDEAVGGR
ncbi:MAG: DNA/RNA non-specific endonuclease [Flavobacteriales bacterium]|nr:DNA/RNA non-specific endonuclease [Flavobacteriales bacterium]MCC6939744.1 DNA/RNA non-specific endonuclease [Flavobacteriales bacterium]